MPGDGVRYPCPVVTIGLVIAAILIVGAVLLGVGILYGLHFALPNRSGSPAEPTEHQRENLPY